MKGKKSLKLEVCGKTWKAEEEVPKMNPCGKSPRLIDSEFRKRDAMQKSARMVVMENPFWLTSEAIRLNVQVQPLACHCNINIYILGG